MASKTKKRRSSIRKKKIHNTNGVEFNILPQVKYAHFLFFEFFVQEKSYCANRKHKKKLRFMKNDSTL